MDRLLTAHLLLTLGEGLHDLGELELLELVDADRHLVRGRGVGGRVRVG